MSEETGEFGNERILTLLAGTDVQTLTLRLSPESERVVRDISKSGGWTYDEALQLAVVYGVAGLAEEEGWTHARPHEADGGEALVRAVQDRESVYAALKFHVHKLHHAIFVMEARITGTTGQNETFTDLIRKLEVQLGAAPD